MDGQLALLEIQDNILSRQPRASAPSAPSTAPLQVQLLKTHFSTGEEVEGDILLHPLIANQVKKVTLTLRGSSPLVTDPKLSLFWIETYPIYVSSRKCKEATAANQTVVLPFRQALPSSSSSKRVREPMSCTLTVEVQLAQSSYLHSSVPFVCAPQPRGGGRSRASSPYPLSRTNTPISRTNTESSTQGKRLSFWPFKG